MFEKYSNLEKKEYSVHDLDQAELTLHEAEDKLNSYDLSSNDIDISESIKVKKDWEEARKKYQEIFNFLNPKSKE